MTNHTRAVHYIASPETPAATAQQIALKQGCDEAILLKRRGTALGWIATPSTPREIDAITVHQRWENSQPYVLPNFVSKTIPTHAQHIEQAKQLMEHVMLGGEFAELLDQPPYINRLTHKFEVLSAMQDEGDAQEIETIEFDVVENNEVLAENLWCKASWLSFEDDDASLRFRFSFGIAGYEDVAADIERQRYAGELTEAIFPESAIITGDQALKELLCKTAGIKDLIYVERIIYFNAPNGGAQFHQDVERGHLGVVFAQLCGRTAWLTCSKIELIDAIQQFVSKNRAALEKLLPDETNLQQLIEKSSDRNQLNLWLDDIDNNEPLEHLLNRCPEFYKQLCDCDHAYIINPGDIILLPQKSIDECAWHTVFCLDEFAGEALSFAIREN